MITVAVIDDDPTLLDLMGELLQERDWSMLPLPDGHTASESVRQALPDVVLLDVRLHGDRTGWDILDELRAGAETGTIPIIIWSGDARLVEEKREWLREQSVLVLAKPFDLDNLYECLDQALNIHRTSSKQGLVARAQPA
jgi:CheY-like chemotaxis protein